MLISRLESHEPKYRSASVFAVSLIVFMLCAVFAGSVWFADEALAVMSNPTGQGEHIAVDPVGHTEGYSAVLYNNTNGLPTSEANDIAETSEGFIWIGSYSGLIRYDGNSFERMDSTAGIVSVVSLYVDSKDRLWVGTNDNGVAVMERGEFRMWGKADGLRSASVRTIVEDENGTIYVATTSGVATIDSDMNLHNLDDDRINESYVRDLRLGSDGLIYGLLQDGSLFTLRDGKVTDFVGGDEIGVGDVVGIGDVIGFLPDPVNPGNLYLGTENDEVYYGSLGDGFKSKVTYDIAPLLYVESLEYIDGQIWICAGNGIGVLDEEGFHQLENLPMDNSVQSMMVDYEGNLWFTSTRQGVMKIVPNQFANLYERYGLDKDVVNSTCMYDGQLFVGTDTGLTVLGEEGVVERLPLKKAKTASGDDLEPKDLIALLDGCRIRSIIRDSKGRLWISTWLKYGLIRYDKGEVMAFSVYDGLFSDRVRTVYERQDGSMLVANTGGVNVVEGDKVVASYGESAGLANTEILTVVEAENGDILAGSDGGGIYVISDGVARHIGTDEGLSSEVVMRIKRDSTRDIYWLVTSNSIAYMTADYQVTTVQRFPYSNNFDLYESGKDDVWVLSSNGIYVCSAEELLDNGDIKPVYYGTDNGLPCIPTANSYSELTPEGDLYIAGDTGVAKVNVEVQFEDVSDLKAAVPFIDADGVRVYPDGSGSFAIGPDTQRLTINSFVYNYSLLNPLVSYHLEGFEDTNTTVSRDNLAPVDYTNLPGGTYEYVMQLNDAMGRGDKEVSFKIVKERAFFEYPIFYIFVVIVLGLLVFGGVMFYTRRKTAKLEKENQETMTLVKEISEAFAKVIDMKDQYTNGHSTRVAKYTVMLARELGYDDETLERYYRIALLHDIGKVGVPSEVLNKPGKLTDEEYQIIQSHTVKGYDALKEISIMPDLAVGAQSHHERPDGKGYPGHLAGDEIPRVAQIIAVADCFDAMYSNRPYRNRMNFDKVVSIIKDVSGTQLTSDVVDAFLRLVEKGEFRDPDDVGGGSTENIVNVK